MARVLIGALAIAASILAIFSPFDRALAQSEPVRLDLRLTGVDLVDEVIHTWLKDPPFANPTNLIVAEINAPIGLDHRFAELIENHLFEVLKANPRLPVRLVHCSLCRQWVTVSQPKKTVIGQALNFPEGLEELRRYPHLHALSLHFDVIVDELILWAEIYEVAPPQKVVWSRRYSQSGSARSVLQSPEHVIGLAEARAEQQRLIEGRDQLQAVTRFPIRTFAASSNGAGVQTPPLIFLEQSLEALVSPKRNKRLGLSIGLTSLQGTMQGWSFGGSYMHLLGRDEPSLTQPDLYLKTGFVYLRLEGPGAAVFSENQLDIARLISADEEPRASLTAYQIGIEAHVKYRFGLSAFIEHIPALENSRTIATRNLIVPFQSFGVAGVLLW